MHPESAENLSAYQCVEAGRNPSAYALSVCLTHSCLAPAAGQSVWSQIAGKVVNERYVESAIGISSVTFAGAVVLLTMATFAPMVLSGESLTSRCALNPKRCSLQPDAAAHHGCGQARQLMAVKASDLQLLALKLESSCMFRGSKTPWRRDWLVFLCWGCTRLESVHSVVSPRWCCRSFGPFKPSVELSVGRVAMLGFSGLVFVETILRGNTAIF